MSRESRPLESPEVPRNSRGNLVSAPSRWSRPLRVVATTAEDPWMCLELLYINWHTGASHKRQFEVRVSASYWASRTNSVGQALVVPPEGSCLRVVETDTLLTSRHKVVFELLIVDWWTLETATRLYVGEVVSEHWL